MFVTRWLNSQTDKNNHSYNKRGFLRKKRGGEWDITMDHTAAATMGIRLCHQVMAGMDTGMVCLSSC